MVASCCNDTRRHDVRAFRGRVGVDFVEVSDDQLSLHVYFLGKLPPEFSQDGPALLRHLRIEGGTRVTDIGIVDVDPYTSSDEDIDDWLVVRLDRRGDHSRYRLRVLDVAQLDPMYDSAEFSFKVGCPSDLDCAPAPACVETPPAEPSIHYLAKDYASFRRLIMDRLALVAPDWDLHHVPDLGVTLVELLAYAGDYLSYYQDAVATEAYLHTARQRISVRRHARLIDYRLHEGCNARAWVAIETVQDVDLPAASLVFLSGIDADAPLATVLGPLALPDASKIGFECFEPLLPGDTPEVRLRVAHNRIGFYGWGRDDGCLPRGATRATLRDDWAENEGAARVLDLQVGDILLLKEMRGPRSGLEVDADPTRVWPVRLTRIVPTQDSLYPVGGGEEGSDPRPTPLLDVEWHADDALPFPLCLSALGPPPGCARMRDISMALGNIVLVDHGRTTGPVDMGRVPERFSDSRCDCEGQPSAVQPAADRFHWRLAEVPLTHAAAGPGKSVAASSSLTQDPRTALPVLRLQDSAGHTWDTVFDLLSSQPGNRHAVAEIDNQGIARLRFGDGAMGMLPAAGLSFVARYRIGNGQAGNVGAGSINRLYLRDGEWSGLDLRISNPLPAHGGSTPETLAQARLLASGSMRTDLQRAVTADDYARIAERDARVQRAACELVWTGSWYEADVALDPRGGVPASASVIARLQGRLQRVRRMGHDLHVEAAIYVPVNLELEVCALPGHERGAVKAALLEYFGAGLRGDGQPGYFHPDRLSFGEPLRASALVAAAMSVPGVECARVVKMHRLFSKPNGELEQGLLSLGSHEIVRLDSDPSHPERGQLSIGVRGGR